MARTSEAAEKTLSQRQSGGGLGYCLWVGAGACGDVQRPYGSEQDDMVLSEDRISTSQDRIFTNRGSRKNLILRPCSFFLQTKHRENQSFQVQKYGNNMSLIKVITISIIHVFELGFEPGTVLNPQ